MDDDIDALIDEHGADRIIAAVRPMLSDERVARFDRVLADRLASVTVVLENLYDPHNGAAAIRSVEAFGVQMLHVVDGPSGPFRPSKEITIGCDKWIDLRRHRDIGACVAALREQGFTLCATLPGATRTLDDLDVERPIAMLFGNERDGLSAEAIAACDERVSIPMHGFTQSFNLSVSVALSVQRLVSRRRAVLGGTGDLDEATRRRLRARWHAMGIRGLGEIVARHVAKQTHG